MMCRDHQYHRLTGGCFLPVRSLYRLPLFLPMLKLAEAQAALPKRQGFEQHLYQPCLPPMGRLRMSRAF